MQTVVLRVIRDEEVKCECGWMQGIESCTVLGGDRVVDVAMKGLGVVDRTGVCMRRTVCWEFLLVSATSLMCPVPRECISPP